MYIFKKPIPFYNALKLMYVEQCLFICLIITTDYLQVPMNENPGTGSIGSL